MMLGDSEAWGITRVHEAGGIKDSVQPARHLKIPSPPEGEVQNLLSRHLALPNFHVSASPPLEERVDMTPSSS